MGASERRKEIKRRRHRRKKITAIKVRAEKASPSEKVHLAEMLRSLTPGADVVINSLQLEER